MSVRLTLTISCAQIFYNVPTLSLLFSSTSLSLTLTSIFPQSRNTTKILTPLGLRSSRQQSHVLSSWCHQQSFVSYYCPAICLLHLHLLLSSIHRNPPTPNLPPPTSFVSPLCDIKAHSYSKLPHCQHAATAVDSLAQKHVTQASPLPVVSKTSSHSSSTHSTSAYSLPPFVSVGFFLPAPPAGLFTFDPSLWPFTLGTFLSSTKTFLCTPFFHQSQLSTFASVDLQLSLTSTSILPFFNSPTFHQLPNTTVPPIAVQQPVPHHQTRSTSNSNLLPHSHLLSSTVPAPVSTGSTSNLTKFSDHHISPVKL